MGRRPVAVRGAGGGWWRAVIFTAAELRAHEAHAGHPSPLELVAYRRADHDPGDEDRS